nr:MAG TPA: hypothetical protein [Caudoviricetes sp.]
MGLSIVNFKRIIRLVNVLPVLLQGHSSLRLITTSCLTVKRL